MEGHIPAIRRPERSPGPFGAFQAPVAPVAQMAQVEGRLPVAFHADVGQKLAIR